MLADDVSIFSPKRATLQELYERHTGKLAHKWDLYLDIYDREFAPYRDRPISLVEIGVQNGGGLEIWAKYFREARALVGCDINTKCGELAFADPRITVIVGSVGDVSTVEAIAGAVDGIDIFLDDGSHVSPQIIGTFYNFWRHIRPGGLYVIEDLHCAYWSKYGGSLDGGAMRFLTLLADAINVAHWRDTDATIASRLAPFLPPDAAFNEYLVSGVRCIRFYDSVCVIEKARPDQRWRVAKPVTGGSVAEVDASPLDNGKA